MSVPAGPPPPRSSNLHAQLHTGGVDTATTSWGGSVHKVDSKYWMFAAEMANHCTLGQWTTGWYPSEMVVEW